MLASTQELLDTACRNAYAIGAFNVYNVEGVKAVVAAAESNRSPAMLQLHPSALKYGKSMLVVMCLEAARSAIVPIAVHLDHSTSTSDIRQALTAGITSIMADGSPLDYPQNLAFTRDMTLLAHSYNAVVEAEIGRSRARARTGRAGRTRTSSRTIAIAAIGRPIAIARG
jgi:tagatose 1,6-diphosphate aldolase GatY/KbaY